MFSVTKLHFFLITSKDERVKTTHHLLYEALLIRIGIFSQSHFSSDATFLKLSSVIRKMWLWWSLQSVFKGRIKSAGKGRNKLGKKQKLYNYLLFSQQFCEIMITFASSYHSGQVMSCRLTTNSIC